MDLKKYLIANGIINLKYFGYPHVDEQNILTDQVYSEFFKGMLKDSLGKRKDVDNAINELLKQIENNPDDLPETVGGGFKK